MVTLHLCNISLPKEKIEKNRSNSNARVSAISPQSGGLISLNEHNDNEAIKLYARADVLY